MGQIFSVPNPPSSQIYLPSCFWLNLLSRALCNEIFLSKSIYFSQKVLWVYYLSRIKPSSTFLITIHMTLTPTHVLVTQACHVYWLTSQSWGNKVDWWIWASWFVRISEPLAGCSFILQSCSYSSSHIWARRSSHNWVHVCTGWAKESPTKLNTTGRTVLGWEKEKLWTSCSLLPEPPAVSASWSLPAT